MLVWVWRTESPGKMVVNSRKANGPSAVSLNALETRHFITTTWLSFVHARPHLARCHSVSNLLFVAQHLLYFLKTDIMASSSYNPNPTVIKLPSRKQQSVHNTRSLWGGEGEDDGYGTPEEVELIDQDEVFGLSVLIIPRSMPTHTLLLHNALLPGIPCNACDAVPLSRPFLRRLVLRFYHLSPDHRTPDLIRSISDPEHPSMTLEQLAVVSAPQITILHDKNSCLVEFTPTVPHCGMSTLIGTVSFFP